MREKYLVNEDWVKDFAPVPIIDIPEFGNLSAVKLVEEMKIQSAGFEGNFKQFLKEV